MVFFFSFFVLFVCLFVLLCFVRWPIGDIASIFYSTNYHAINCNYRAISGKISRDKL